MDMSTDIDALPGADQVTLPPELEDELNDLQVEEGGYQMTQPMMQVQGRPYMKIKEKREWDILRMMKSREFILLICILLLADSRFLNVNVIRKIPLNFVKMSSVFQTVIKVIILAVLFLLIKEYVFDV